MGRRRGIPGLSFSWKRATGLSNAKRQVSNQIGVPLTRAGRQRKIGNALGCCVPAAFLLVGVTSAAMIILQACSDSGERYDVGYDDGYASGFNTTCQIRATLFEGDYENEDYSRGINEGYAAGSQDCLAQRASEDDS